MDGTYITATRTAAAAALAARLLARADAKILAIIGTGVQARTHLRAFAPVRDWAEVRIAGRDHEKAEALAAELGARATSFEDAIRGADVVAAATHSAEPVVRAEWVAPGTHVSSVGYNAPGFGARSGARPRGDDRRRVAGLVLRSAARRGSGARGRRSGLGRRARRARERQSGAAGPPRWKLRCTSPSASPFRISPPRLSCWPRPENGKSGWRSSWRRSTHERIQPRPRRSRCVRDGDRRAGQGRRRAPLSRSDRSRISSGRFRSRRCGGSWSTSRSSPACPPRTASSSTEQVATCPTCRRRSRRSAASGSSGS